MPQTDAGTNSSRGRFSPRRIGKVADGPGTARHGAAIALALATAVLLAWSTWDQHVPGTGGATATQTAANLLLALAISGLVTGVLFVTAGRRLALPWTYLWTLLSCLVLLVTLGGGASPTAWYVTVAVVVVGTSLLGAATGALLPASDQTPRRGRALTALASAVVLLAAPALWLATATQGAPEPVDEESPSAPHAADPAAPGPFETASLTYGSGTDDRPAYGSSADLETPPVDTSAILGGWDDRRESLWGFGSDAFPLNARVWYPTGDGPFPLVLIAHGNKSNATSSEDGFTYLGETLAGQGFIVAAADQNFLNTGPLDRSGGLTGAETARGWLLLEHLRVWDEWNRDPSNLFAGKVDTENVGLIGHSRGGEAIAVATYLSQRGGLPGESTTEVAAYDGIAVRSLLALAPSDGQYLPDDEPVRLQDVDYLVLQGSHDADVNSFGGLNQYERIDFTGSDQNVKSALYIGHADHSHFNTRWGGYDVGNGLPKHFLDTGTLMRAEDQRRIAEVYASAFLRGTLNGETELFEILRDHRAAAPFLPEAEYVNQYVDSDTAYADESAITAAGAAEGGPRPLALRSGSGEDEVFELSWEDGAENPAVTAEIDPATGADLLVFDALAATEDADAVPEATVRLTDADGRTAELPLSDFMPLQPLVNGQYLKAAWMHPAALTEPVLQTYSLPLAAFAESEPAFDPSALEAASLEFDGAATAAVLIDDIGLMPT